MELPDHAYRRAASGKRWRQSRVQGCDTHARSRAPTPQARDAVRMPPKETIPNPSDNRASGYPSSNDSHPIWLGAHLDDGFNAVLDPELMARAVNAWEGARRA